MRCRFPTFVTVALVAAGAATAQSTPAGQAADVATLDGIMTALYDVISGPAGQKRDWDRMRSLFTPGARLIPTGRRPDTTGMMRVMDVEQYVSGVGPRLEEGGFFEREIARRVEEYGNIAHVFSTYESRRQASDPSPFARGINSIQLWFDGKRWWIVSIFWASESPDRPIPARYLERQPA